MGAHAGTRSGEQLNELRDVVRNTAPAPAEMEAYLQKVHLHAYRVTDEDVAALKERFTEDEIFEQTVAAAISEGLYRLDAAERVL